WEATLVQNAAIRSNPTSPETLLGLPGINPIIPLGYGILGLAVAIILHEFSHGILSRVANIKIRSLGLIFLIFPIGAFVEPDEDELRALPRREAGRLYVDGAILAVSRDPRRTKSLHRPCGSRHLCVRCEHRLLPSADQPGQVWRRDEGDPRLRLAAFLRLFAD